MTHDEFEKRLDSILAKVDHLKTEDAPDGNPFFPGSISVAEAKQAIKQLFRDVVGEDENDDSPDILEVAPRLRNQFRQQLRTIIGDE